MIEPGDGATDIANKAGGQEGDMSKLEVSQCCAVEAEEPEQLVLVELLAVKDVFS